MNKILVKLYVPTIDAQYDVWIPLNKKIGNVVKLLIQAINELSGGYYVPRQMPVLYDKLTAKEYDVNLTVKESGIINGTEIVII